MSHEQIIKEVLSNPELIAEVSEMTNDGGVTIYEHYKGGISTKRTSPSNTWSNAAEINIPSSPKGKGLKLTPTEVVSFLKEEVDVLNGYSYSPTMATRIGLDGTL